MGGVDDGQGDHRFKLVDHVCRACMGRLLERLGDDGVPVFACSNCGAEAPAQPGLNWPPLCACSLTVDGVRDMGVRCVRNERRGPEGLLSVIVAAEVA
jgi:hypothetical protein